MKKIIQYIFQEVKRKKIAKTDALDMISQLESNIADSKLSKLHPILHENTSNLTEQRFTSTFTGNENFIADHVVQGQKILPGVAYLEMARAAVEQATGVKIDDQTQVSLKNVVWAQPIMVNSHSVKIHIGLLPEDSGAIRYEVYQETEDDRAEPIVFSQGYAQIVDAIEAHRVDIPALQASCDKGVLTAEQCYEEFKSNGIEYGPSFQGLEQVYVGKDQVLAKLNLPSCVSDNINQFILHPSIIDAALQAAIGLANRSGNNKPMLPFALDSLEVWGPCTAAMWALVTRGKASTTNSKVRKFNFDLCDKTAKYAYVWKDFPLEYWKAGFQPICWIHLQV